MSIGLRIKRLRKEKKLTQKAFSETLKIDNSQMSKIERGKIQPTIQQLLEISSILKTTTDYLIAGKENALKTESDNFVKSYINRRGAPYYDVDFFGGFDWTFNEQTTKPSFYVYLPVFQGVDYWVNVTGRSMSPFISHGDIVALRQVFDWQNFIVFGEVYAVITNNDFRTIKIVTRGKSKDFWRLKPYNESPEFVEQEIPKAIITSVFKVVGSVKKFF